MHWGQPRPRAGDELRRFASVWTKSQVSRLMGVSQWPRKRGNAIVTQTVKIVARAQVANKAHSTPT